MFNQLEEKIRKLEKTILQNYNSVRYPMSSTIIASMVSFLHTLLYKNLNQSQEFIVDIPNSYK